MLSVGDKKDAESCYNKISGDIDSLYYHINADILKVKEELKNTGLIGWASKYIENL